MKKLLIIIILTIALLLTACGVTQVSNNVEREVTLPEIDDEPEILFSSIEHDWAPYLDVESLINDVDIVVVGKVLSASFHVLESGTGLVPTQETPWYERFFATRYEIDVIMVFKGEPQERIEVGRPGGTMNYRVEEQMSLVREFGLQGIPIPEESMQLEIGETYLFTLSKARYARRAHDEDLNLYGFLNPVQCRYTIDNPFAKKVFTDEILETSDLYSQSTTEHGLPIISAYDIISVFGDDVWDEFWQEWQRDNPDWETRIDRAAVEDLFAKRELR